MAIGMVLDARYSVEAGLLVPEALDRILSLLAVLGLPAWDDALDQVEPGGRLAVLRGLEEFREHLGGDLHVTLLRAVGGALSRCTQMDEGRVAKAHFLAAGARPPMIVGGARPAHLTYCTNIHPGETWTEVRRNLETHVIRVKALVSPNAPFGVGLRLSGAAAHDLAEPGGLRRASTLPLRSRPLRLHHQRLSLRPFSRDPGQGAGLPARLAGGRTACTTRTPSRACWPGCFPTALPGASAPSRVATGLEPTRTRREPWPIACCGTWRRWFAWNESRESS